MTPNAVLADVIAQRGLAHGELAETLNDRIGELTGRRGLVSDRTIRRYLSGQTTWPQSVQRAALEAEFGKPAAELGFVPPAGHQKKPGDPRPAGAEYDQEADPVLRRTLFTATTAAALAAATPAVARPTIGTADVDRLRRHVDRLVAMDDQDGGGPAIERLAVQLTAHALDVQQSSSATQRVRGRLYGLAAEFAAHALWAAVDAGQLDRAQQHLEKAVTLAGLSGDGQVQHQTWRYAAMLADQRGHRTDAIAAAEAAAATAAHRTDPAYASLSAMRLALALTMPGAHDRTRALRAIDRATTAYDRADPHRVRPPSMAFYDRGEVSGLTGIALLRMGQPEQAEFHMHRALSSLRPDQARNRSYYTAQIALAQADQGEADQAVATAHRITPPPGSATTGRVHRLIGQFTDTLTRTAPGARATREWIAHTRTATA